MNYKDMYNKLKRDVANLVLNENIIISKINTTPSNNTDENGYPISYTMNIQLEAYSSYCNPKELKEIIRGALTCK